MRISRYCLSVSDVPVDFFADPDGCWEFQELVEAAGFDPNRPGVCVGALIQSFNEHPEGAAVVTEMGAARPYVAVVECPSSRAGTTCESIAIDAAREVGRYGVSSVPASRAA